MIKQNEYLMCRDLYTKLSNDKPKAQNESKIQMFLSSHLLSERVERHIGTSVGHTSLPISAQALCHIEYSLALKWIYCRYKTCVAKLMTI